MNPLIERLGWTLIHSLWEGTLVWVGLRLVLICLRRNSAQARYLAGCGALGIAILAPWMTFFRLNVSAARPSIPAAAFRLGPELGRVSGISMKPVGAGSEAWLETLQRNFAAIAPWLVLAWMLGSVWASLRLILSWRAARQLATAPFRPLPESIYERVLVLAAKLGIRRVVRLGETVLVEVPSVVGWIKPVILVPVGAFTGLSASQVDALLGHELAHVLRHDFLVNLLQSICDVVFFYHPAVLAINRSICEEREHACDDLAVALTGDPLGYAAALAQLEAARGPALALAATGDGHLLERVRRLLGGSPGKVRDGSIGAWATFAGVWLYVAVVAATPRVFAQLADSEPRAASTGTAKPAGVAAGQMAKIQPSAAADSGAGGRLPPKKHYEAMAAIQAEVPETVITSDAVVDSSVRSQFDLEIFGQDLLSRRVRERVMDSYSAQEMELLRGPYDKSDDTINVFGTITVEYDTANRTIYIFARHRDSKAAALIANRYVRELIGYLTDSFGADNQVAVDYLRQRSEQLRRISEGADRKLEDLQRTIGVGGVATKEQAQQEVSLTQAAATAKARYETIQTRLKQAQETKRVAKVPLKQIITATPMQE